MKSVKITNTLKEAIDMTDGKKKQAGDLHSLRREFKEGLESVSALLKSVEARNRRVMDGLAMLEKRLTQNRR